MEDLFLIFDKLKSDLKTYCVTNGVMEIGAPSLEDISKIKAALQEDRSPYVSALQEQLEIVRNQIISKNFGLIHLVLKKYKLNGSSLYDDLYQEGIFGLMRATDRFDYSRGLSFSSYAVWWIRDFVGSNLKKSESSGRGRESDDSIEDLEDTSELPDKFVENKEVKNIVSNIVEKVLSEKEARVISHRFTLGGKDYKTLQALADDEAISKEAVRLIQKKALNKVKNGLKAFDLID